MLQRTELETKIELEEQLHSTFSFLLLESVTSPEKLVVF